MFAIVTVRCGHCANLLSVNMGALLQTIPAQDLQVYILPGETNNILFLLRNTVRQCIYMLLKICQIKGRCSNISGCFFDETYTHVLKFPF